MNLLLHILAFFALGVAIYYLDSKFGLKLHRWWYNLTHKHPLAEGKDKGMIIDQSFIQKVIIAVPFVLLEIYLSSFLGAGSLFVDIVMGASGVVGMVLGFYFAGKILKIMPGTVGRAVDYLEKVESGEANIKDDLLGGATAMGTKITDTVAEAGVKKVIDKFKPEKEKDFAKEAEPEPLKTESEELENNDKKEDESKDWRDGIDKFLKK